jgi:hypothetical protein
MTILHSQCLPTELVKTANAVAINSVSGPVTGVVAPTSAPATGASVWYIDTATTPDNLYYWNGSVWALTGDGTGSSALLTQDESVALGSTTTMNFAGGGVTATYAAGVTTVTVPSATVLDFQDEGVALSATSTVNFAGAGVVATNAAGVTTVTIPGGAGTFATNAEAQAGTSTALMVNPANLYARENIAAQTGLGLVLASIPAPTAAQSNWGTNTLGETLHYMPNVGWKIVADRYNVTQNTTTTALPNATIVSIQNIVAPRAGVVDITAVAHHRASGSAITGLGVYIYINGVFDALRSTSVYTTITVTNSEVNSVAAAGITVATGDIIELRANQQSATAGANQLDRSRLTVSYTN